MQTDETITYQIATYYLSKIALRIEVLYEQIEASSKVNQASAHHLALIQTIELSKLIEKPELKSRFLKELMRFDYTLNKQINALPESIQLMLHEQIQILSHVTQRFGEKLLQNPLLQAVYANQHQHNEVNQDPPALLYWLEQSPQNRQDNLREWLSHLKLLYEVVKLYLLIIRHAAPFQTIQIQHGFYQQAIHEKRTCCLIMLRFSRNVFLIPKIQVGHYGITIRLCEGRTLKEVHLSDVQFELAICLLH